MPLELGGIETTRPQLVVWDSSVLEEAQEASHRIRALMRIGYSLDKSLMARGEAKLTPPDMDPNKGMFCILSENGDDRVVWDRRIKDQVKEAFKKFKELLEKGYSAYIVRADGSRGHKITEFDPGLEEIILGAKKAVLVPCTMPG